MTFIALVKRWGVLALGLVLAVGGLIVSTGQPASFGWFAYAPMSDRFFMPAPSPFIVMPTGAAAMLAIGVILMTGWAGFQLGRRAPRER